MSDLRTLKRFCLLINETRELESLPAICSWQITLQFFLKIFAKKTVANTTPAPSRPSSATFPKRSCHTTFLKTKNLLASVNFWQQDVKVTSCQEANFPENESASARNQSHDRFSEMPPFSTTKSFVSNTVFGQLFNYFQCQSSFRWSQHRIHKRYIFSI